MQGSDVEGSHKEAVQAGLLGRAGALAGGLRPGGVLGFALAVAGIAGALIASGAMIQTAQARGETAAIRQKGETIAREREQAAAMADSLSLPPMATVLAGLRAHLPPDVRLAEAARDGEGVLTIAIDTPDPDALRAALAADRRLARFRERGQEAREDGIRVRLRGEWR